MPPPDRSSDHLLAESAFVHRLARALVRDADVAHDVAQDALLAAQQQSVAPRSLRDWLAAVARRLATQSQRARARRARHELAAAKPPTGEHEARTLERLRLHQRLTAAVMELPEPYRTAVTLRFLDELPPRAIAQRLQTSSDVVRQRVHRGLELLRARLDVEFGDREAWAGAFVAAGFGSVSALSLLLPVLLMNKLLVVAAAVIVAGAFCFWPSPELAPSVGAPDAMSSAAQSSVAAAASPAKATNATPTRLPMPDVASPACVLVVVDEHGSPIAGARCHTYATGSEFVVGGTSDTQGCCRFEAVDGRGGVVIHAEGHAPHWTELEERVGEHRIVVPDGAEVRGTLLVDGPPGKDYELWLSGPWEHPPLPRALVASSQSRGLACMRTDADGTFRCRGLAPGWRGHVLLPMALLLLPESGGNGDVWQFPLTAGSDPVTIRTTRLPGPRLRIVWQDTAGPVGNAEVTAHGEFDALGCSPSTSMTADRDGVCRLGLRAGRDSTYLQWCKPERRPALVNATVSVRAPGSDGSVRRTLAGEELKTDAEVVIRLPRARTTHFLAVDTTGRPVAGARVQAQGISEPTGADGRGTFAGVLKDVRAIGAPGHQVRTFTPRAPAAGTAEDPLVVELPADNSLTLRFVDASGQRRRVGRAAVRGDTWFFAGGRRAFDLDREMYGQSTSGHWTPAKNPNGSERVTDYHLALGPVDGESTLHSLEPGMACTVIVHDALGEPFAEQAVTTPPIGVHEVVDVRLAGYPLDLRCQVVDSDGNPIASSTVSVSRSDGGGNAMQRGADGTFQFHGICRVASVNLTANAEGYVSRCLEGVAAADPSLHAIMLERGHMVRVRVVDEHDQPQPLQPYVLAPRSQFPYDDLAPGERRFRNLPPAIVTFACTIGGKRFTLDHDARVGEAVLHVQRPGELRFACASTWPGTGERRYLAVLVQRLDADDPPIDRSQPEHGAEVLLVPGRYRVNLCEGVLHDDAPTVFRDLGRSTEVTIVAGTTTTAILP